MFLEYLLCGFSSALGTYIKNKLITIDYISNTFSKMKKHQVSTLLVCWLKGYGPYYDCGFRGTFWKNTATLMSQCLLNLFSKQMLPTRNNSFFTVLCRKKAKNTAWYFCRFWGTYTCIAIHFNLYTKYGTV